MNPDPPTSTLDPRDLDTLCDFLGRYRYRFTGEKQLQVAIAAAFDAHGVEFEREVKLAPGDVIDFVVQVADGVAVGVEVKLGGSPAAVAAQLLRYARSPRLAAVVLVTGRCQHLIYSPDAAPATLGGKPIRAVVLPGGF